MKPWGHIDWILKWYPNKSWTIISGVSFEPRSSALIEHISTSSIVTTNTYAIRIDEAENEFTQEIQRKTDCSYAKFKNSTNRIILERANLFESSDKWDYMIKTIAKEGDQSVLFDISSLPKRVSLFIIKKLLRSNSIKDIVVCYTRAGEYREGALSFNERPPDTLPGFGSISSLTRDKVFVVSVGYTRLHLRQVLQESSSQDIHFLMPFPPASPSFRRTWRFLKMLNEDIEPARPIIHRYHAMDMFATYQWLVGNISSEKLTTMLPLGPKPHSVAMALAQMKNEKCSQLVYPQPQIYYPDYSNGVHLGADGRPSIIAYGLRRDYCDVLNI